MAYGGPARLEDVEAYLLDVRGGRPTSAEMVREVQERYRRIGGRSPILEQTERQAAALEQALNSAAMDGTRFRAFVGMRHWRPYIQDTLARMQAEGIERAVGLVMAPHFSRLSIGAYQQKVQEAAAPIEVAHIDNWHLHPGYLEALVERVRAALERFPEAERDQVRVVFTAHSLPRRILEWGDPYPAQLGESAADLAQRLGGTLGTRFFFAYQSAAMTAEPWLGPDAGEVLERLAQAGARAVLIAPIGFVCDHVEILYDVDVVFRAQAERLGLQLERIEMLKDSPLLVAGLAERVRAAARERRWL